MKCRLLSFLVTASTSILLTLAIPTNILAVGVVSSKHGLDNGLSQNVYVDSKGFFQVRPPNGWVINEYQTDPRGKVDFNSSTKIPRAQLKIIGQISSFSTLNELVHDCKNGGERLRAKYGGTFSVDTVTQFGTNAVETTWIVPAKFKQKAIHVLIGKNYYTFAFGAPLSMFEKYYPIVQNSIQSFEPLENNIGGTAESHIIASKIRTAEFYLQLGRKDWASAVVDEGLSVDKANNRLLELKEQCKD